MRAVRVALLAVVTAASPLAARAEVLAIPFVGSAFQGQTTLPLSGVNLASAPVSLSKSLVTGGAVTWLSSRILGAEAELAYSPRFFERAQSLGSLASPVSGSSVTMLGGNLVVAVPRSVTRDSLRPYVVGGVGTMRARLNGTISINSIQQNLLAVTIGGGVIGYLGEHSGVRFDLRRTRGETSGAQLSFWRATVGVTFRY